MGSTDFCQQVGEFIREIESPETSQADSKAQVEEHLKAITSFLAADITEPLPPDGFPPLSIVVACALLYDVSIVMWAELTMQQAIETLCLMISAQWMKHMDWIRLLPSMLGNMLSSPLSDEDVPNLYLALCAGLQRDPCLAISEVMDFLGEKGSKISRSKLVLSKPGPDFASAKKSVTDAFSKPLKFMFQYGTSQQCVHLLYNHESAHCQPLNIRGPTVQVEYTTADGRCLIHCLWLAAKGQ